MFLTYLKQLCNIFVPVIWKSNNFSFLFLVDTQVVSNYLKLMKILWEKKEKKNRSCSTLFVNRP